MTQPITSSNQGLNGAAINWSVALQKHLGWLRTVVRSRVGDSHTADDIVQNLTFAVLKSPRKPTESARVAPWLYRIAVRETINHRRRKGRQSKRIDFGVAPADQIDTSPGPRDWVLKNELSDSVRTAIKQLSAKDREILLLKYTEGWSYGELAAHLGVTAKTIEHRLARAREAMRQQLRKRGFGESAE